MAFRAPAGERSGRPVRSWTGARLVVAALLGVALASPLAGLATPEPQPTTGPERPIAAAGDSLLDLFEGVGETPHSRLRFFFEVTFMKIDIAWVEAYLDPGTAAVVERVVSDEYTKGRARALEMALLDGNPMLLRMELARGGGAGRFIGATRDNLRAAVKCGAMEQATFDDLWPFVETLLAPIDSRGMEKGDSIHYRVDGSSIRVVYLSPTGHVLVDGTYESEDAARGFVGSFMCREAAFSENLIRSAWTRLD